MHNNVQEAAKAPAIMDAVLDNYGSKMLMAERLHTSPQVVGKWFKSGRIPVRGRRGNEMVNWVLIVEKDLDCSITRQQMRPDVYPS